MIETLSNLTGEQQAAICTRNVSIALSAGAGCGKTFVLTERVLSHLEPGDPDAPPADLHELVAITFTDRAAREMRDRIRDKCYERLAQATPEHSDYWLRLLRSLETARISTIHSFCGALLRAHAVEAGLDPRFTIIEQAQADTLAAELIDDVLRERLAAQDKILINLIVEFGIDRLREMIGAILSHGRLIDFENWLDRKPANLVNVWRRFHSEVAVPAALEQFVSETSTQKLLTLISRLTEAEGELRNRSDAISELIGGLRTSKSAANDLHSIFENARVEGVHNKDLWPSDVVYEEFRDAATQVRKHVTKTQQLLEFNATAAEASAQLGLDLLSVVQAVFDRYEQRKAELSWLDFNDLLTRTRELLTSSAHAEDCRANCHRKSVCCWSTSVRTPTQCRSS